MRRGGYILAEGADTCVFKPKVDCEPGTESAPIPPGEYVSRIVDVSEREHKRQREVKEIVDESTVFLNKLPVATGYLGDRPFSSYFNFAVAWCTPKFKPEDFKDNAGQDASCKLITPDENPSYMANMITPEQGDDLKRLEVTPGLMVELERLFHAAAYLAVAGIVHFDLHFGNIAVIDDHLVMHDWGRVVITEREFFHGLNNWFGSKQERDEFIEEDKYYHFIEPAKFLNKDPSFIRNDAKRDRFMRVYDVLAMAGSLGKFIKNEEVVQTNLVAPIHALLEKNVPPGVLSYELHKVIKEAFVVIEKTVVEPVPVESTPVPTPSAGGARMTRRSLSKKELSQKFCKCVKSVRRKMGERAAIGVCTRSVLHTRGLTLKKFTCGKRGRLTTQRMYPADPQDAVDDTAERIRKTTNDIRSTLKSSDCVKVDMRGTGQPTPTPQVSPMPLGTPVVQPSYVYSPVQIPTPVQSRPTPQLVYPSLGRSQASGTPVYISVPAGSISGTRPYSLSPLSPSPQYLSMPPSRSLQMMTQPQIDCRSPSTMPR